MQKTEEEGSCFEESLAVFRNTRNESGYSPNQLFFLRNWWDPNLPHMLVEPVVEEMVEATDKVKAGSKVHADNHKRGWPKLHLSDMVRGRHPKTKEWRMKGRWWRWSMETGLSMWHWRSTAAGCSRGRTSGWNPPRGSRMPRRRS